LVLKSFTSNVSVVREHQIKIAIHPMFGLFTPQRSFVSIMAAVLLMQVLSVLVVVLVNPWTLTLLTALVVYCWRYILRSASVCLKWLLKKLLWTLVYCCLMTVLWSFVQAWMWCSLQKSLPLLYMPPWESLDVSTCMQNAARGALSAMCGRLFALW